MAHLVVKKVSYDLFITSYPYSLKNSLHHFNLSSFLHCLHAGLRAFSLRIISHEIHLLGMMSTSLVVLMKCKPGGRNPLFECPLGLCKHYITFCLSSSTYFQ